MGLLGLSQQSVSVYLGTMSEQETKGSEQEIKGRYAFVSLGCPKNLVDSERMQGHLQLVGYELVDEPQGADFAVVNTC